MNRDRKTSEGGIDLIKTFEGLRLQAYQDSVGIWSIGFGSTRDVREGDQITRQEADQRLRDDLDSAEMCIRSTLNMVRLTQHQWDALVSFAYNIGCRAFRNSTMCRLLEMGDFDGAAEQFKFWTRAGSEHPTGLIRRREAEAAWFRTPDGDV